MDRSRFLKRAFGFAAIFVLLFAALNSFLQPIWFYENNFHTVRGFYEQPEDTVETVFVGASMTVLGFSPMEMYEQNGVCAYNLASASQPMMMSYFWIKEAHRLHAASMDTVVLDVSMLRRASAKEDYRRALDGMRLSPVKNAAIDAYGKDFDDAASCYFPYIAYHERWASIDYSDFFKYFGVVEDYARGFNMEFTKIYDTTSEEQTPVPLQVVENDTESTSYQREALFYFKRIINFCKLNNIRLVLCKTPSPANWSNANHNDMQELANRYGLEFLDFEVEPLLSELDYSVPLDSKDTSKHLNYNGAMKLSAWMGNYLAETCENTDVRGDPRYDFLEDQLARYHKKVTALANAVVAEDPAEYLSQLIEGDNYSVLIAVKDDGSEQLTDSQRATFGRLGLERLSKIQLHDSYLAVVIDGQVVCEQLGKDPKTGIDDALVDMADDVMGDVPEVELNENQAAIVAVRENVAGQQVGDDDPFEMEGIALGDWVEDDADKVPLATTGVLPDGTRYTLTSGGFNLGNTTSCLIDDVNQSPGSRGINVVVYDNDSHRVVDKAAFDTYSSDQRETQDYQQALDEALANGTTYLELPARLQKLYRYNAKYDYKAEAKALRREIGKTGLYQYLANYADRDNVAIYVALKDEGAAMLTPEARAALVGLGFAGIGQLQEYGSYCAVLEDGVLAAESVTPFGESTSLNGSDYKLTSTGSKAKIVLNVDGYAKDYSKNGRGLNVVVYDKMLKMVIDQTSFDTHAYEVVVPGITDVYDQAPAADGTVAANIGE